MNRQHFRGKAFKYTGQCIAIFPIYKEHFEMTLATRNRKMGKDYEEAIHRRTNPLQM